MQDFIIQGGDPTGTGTGGESIYGRPFRVRVVIIFIMFNICNPDIILMFCSNFQDEFHTRLRFIRRGLVAMANAGPHDNGSQFFFTLGRADELNNKHTIFGKVGIPNVESSRLQNTYLTQNITDDVKVVLNLLKLHSLASFQHFSFCLSCFYSGHRWHSLQSTQISRSSMWWWWKTLKTSQNKDCRGICFVFLNLFSSCFIF